MKKFGNLINWRTFSIMNFHWIGERVEGMLGRHGIPGYTTVLKELNMCINGYSVANTVHNYNKMVSVNEKSIECFTSDM